MNDFATGIAPGQSIITATYQGTYLPPAAKDGPVQLQAELGKDWILYFCVQGKKSWLTETGVPVCGDYPGPDCAPWIPYRASLEESAAFEIQSAAYGMFVGLDGYFHFQLYDDCGNEYDAFGMFRNPAWYSCNNQSPYPNQARPSINSFKVNRHYLQGLEPLWRMRPGGPDPYTGPQEWIAFYRPNTHQRVLALWARFYDNLTATVQATGNNALLVDQTGATQTVVPAGGNYTLALPAATNFNQHQDGSAAIGGRPYLLIETDTRAPGPTSRVAWPWPVRSSAIRMSPGPSRRTVPSPISMSTAPESVKTA